MIMERTVPVLLPPYAILSHTWGADKDGSHWTTYARDAAKARLADVPASSTKQRCSSREKWAAAFHKSRWHTRGWTLQELLAPVAVQFFSQEWRLLGDKNTLSQRLQDATGLPARALRGDPLFTFTVEERMRWMEKRQTTKAEDRWYSLLGIFGVHMSLIYGEGRGAESRLKNKIAKACRAQLDTNKRDFHEPLNFFDGDEVMNQAKFLASLRFDQMDSQKVKPMHEILVSFYFNARGDLLERSTVGMYRSILLQVLECLSVEDFKHIMEDFRCSRRNRTLVPPWTVTVLHELLSRAVAHLGDRRLRCFIDALDECDEEQVREMIDLLEELGQTALDSGHQVLICFASRHYPSIDIRNSCRLTLENQDGHAEDMRKYVKERLRAGEGKRTTYIRDKIQQKASRVFMWAVLVVEILNREFRAGRIFAVETRLEELPPELSDLFQDMLERDSTNIAELLLCL
ncbi:hypothetical protein LTR56_003023 [Elasticomyces elasticus]|nr:hypothetical protein LTR56_003023 [Elasticomyces elasticus]KAK3662086.1 hypothetical protein LTR22_007058 [Elasticomyces elasticus]KAK4927551.1 hypothetical protein LTR49_005692 [Elasticomyces elasticus]KAK5753236.1 hypothetical protein LTS12_016703 [Elasticomyces elasticus]